MPIEREKQLLDFIIGIPELIQLYPFLTREQASKRLYHCRKRLKKPPYSELTAVEFGKIKGLSIGQIYDLSNRAYVYRGNLEGIKTDN